VDDEVDPRDALLSCGFGACLGAWNPFTTAGFFFGGFVIRRVLLTDLLVSLFVIRAGGKAGEQDLLYHIGDVSISTFCLSLDACNAVWSSPIALQMISRIQKPRTVLCCPEEVGVDLEAPLR